MTMARAGSRHHSHSILRAVGFYRSQQEEANIANAYRHLSMIYQVACFIGKDMRSTTHPPLDKSVSAGESYFNSISEGTLVTLLSRDVPDFLTVNQDF